MKASKKNIQSYSIGIIMNQQVPSMNKTCNNKHQGCPALMADGRVFTDYRPSTYVNDMIRFSNNLQSSYDYRQFLTHNARNIMTVNDRYTHKKLDCNGVQSVVIPDQSICAVSPDGGHRCEVTNPRGVGTRSVVAEGMAPQLGMEGHIHGYFCGSMMNASPLTPQFDHQKHARF